MTTQLEAQAALTAVLAAPVRTKTDTTITAGSAVTLLWLRSFLEPNRITGPHHLRHEYRVFGFDDKGRYADAEASDEGLTEIVYLNLQPTERRM